MGANPTQAQGFALFLVAFVLIAVGMATGMNFLYILPGLILLGLSCALFLKCKPWEHIEE
jgi:hypothetical protein